MRLVIIANPTSGGGRGYRSIQNHIRRWPHKDWEVEVLTTKSCGHAGLLAQELLSDPPDLLGICGGDGTVNEVVSRITDPPFPVALIPAGTANVIARELGLPLNPIQSLQIALKRTVRRVDLGEISAGARRFLFVAGIGFDAYVVARVQPEFKKRLGMAAYAVAIVDCLRTYDFPDLHIVAGDQTYRATSCLACNAKSYGGGLLFCPDAEMGDGQLDILVLEGRDRLRLARFLIRAWLGIAETGGWIHRVRTRTLRIDGDARALVQADGELAGNLPIEISLLDKAFPLVIKPKL